MGNEVLQILRRVISGAERWTEEGAGPGAVVGRRGAATATRAADGAEARAVNDEVRALLGDVGPIPTGTRPPAPQAGTGGTGVRTVITDTEGMRGRLVPLQAIPGNHVGGIAADHVRRLSRYAQARGWFIMVTQTKPAGLRWHGVPGVEPKPSGLKAKTQSVGEYAGLVTDPTHPGIRRQWETAIARASPTIDQHRLRQEYELAQSVWRANLDTMRAAGFEVDVQGRVFQAVGGERRYFHPDYDLVGIVDRDGELVSHTVDPDSHLGVNPAAAASAERRLRDLNARLGGQPMFTHGGSADPFYQGSNYGAQFPMVVFTPEGGTVRIADMEQLRAAFTSRGARFPHDLTNDFLIALRREESTGVAPEPGVRVGPFAEPYDILDLGRDDLVQIAIEPRSALATLLEHPDDRGRRYLRGRDDILRMQVMRHEMDGGTAEYLRIIAVAPKTESLDAFARRFVAEMREAREVAAAHLRSDPSLPPR